MDDLRRIDLNLLLTLHALLVDRHVTRAAQRLHKSQPAVSHALAQLRGIFDDPLLVRRDGGLALTPRAQALERPLEAALEDLRGILRTPGFDPHRVQRSFRLALSDYGARLILPALMRQLRQDAPGIDLAVTQASREAMLAQLADDDIDAALGVFPKTPPSIHTGTLFDEHFISVADRATVPAVGLTRTEWLARPHVLVAMRPDGHSEIDEALAAARLKRRIALVLPHWSAALEVIAGTDLVLTVASRCTTKPIKNSHLRRFAPPIDLAPFAFQQAWHARRTDDAAHVWLRERIAQCVSSA